MKKISFQLSDQQYKAYEDAAAKMLSLGIPVEPKSLIQIIITNRNPAQITDDFLTLMRKLVNKGKKEIRQQKESGPVK